MQAAETTIDVVGNNVANSQTVGFKESDAIFATQFLQTIGIGSAPTTNSGGTNPRQVGLGVKVAEITPDFTQGTIEISSNPLDVAIQGDGFLIVQSGNGQLFTRNGQLKLNRDNEVVNATGQRVLGFPVNDDFVIQNNTEGLVPLSIPLGKERVSQPTANAVFSGVLNPSVDRGATPAVSESVVIGNGTVPQPQAVSGVSFDISDFLEAEPPVVSAVVGTPTGAGSGPDADNPVVYRIVFLDDSGQLLESAPSAELSVDNSGGAGQIDLSALPTGTGAWTGGWRIYRQESGGTTFYQVGEQTNTATPTFSDTVAEAALAVPGNELDTELIEPGSYSYYVSYYDSTNQVETRPTARIGTRSIATPGGRIRIDLSDLATPTHPEFYVRPTANLSQRIEQHFGFLSRRYGRAVRLRRVPPLTSTT